MTPIFADTNVFAYLFDDNEPVKRDMARAVVAEHRRQIVVSTQVLLELHSVCTRKLGMDRAAAHAAVRPVAGFPVVGADRELILDAMLLAEEAQLSIFDAAIIAAARRGGCATLLTEDLAEGRTFGEVRVENPFSGAR